MVCFPLWIHYCHFNRLHKITISSANMFSGWNIYTSFNPPLRTSKTPQSSNFINLPSSNSMLTSHQLFYFIPSAFQSLQTISAPFISSQTLFYSLPSHFPPFSHPSQVLPFPPFKDHHEIQSQAENTHLNDFDEFFTELDSFRIFIFNDAAVEHLSWYLQNERHGFHSE